jgi:hypothetical protein
MAFPVTYINGIAEYVSSVKRDTQAWDFASDRSAAPWFRGQDRDDGPLPKLFRAPGYDEFQLTRLFRERAGAFGNAPETDRLDKWLFLMQHYGAATRLLDWTESPLIALYFALKQHSLLPTDLKPVKLPTVWALNPLTLNALSKITGFPNTWSRYDQTTTIDGIAKTRNTNPGVEYFRLAFHPRNEWVEAINTTIVDKPIAVQTTYYDLRMYSQRSCFTIHGIDERDFEAIAESVEPEKVVLKYKVPYGQGEPMLRDLTNLGINQATIFPDMAGLADELTSRYRK